MGSRQTGGYVMRFTSKQVTTMVVAGCAAAILMPTAAIAAGSLVTITDPITNAKARVTGAGALLTQGSVVQSVEASPWARFGRAGNNAVDRVVLDGPTPRLIETSSLTVAARDGAVAVRLRAVEPTDGSCAAGHVVIVRQELMSFIVPAGTTHSVSFPSPIVSRPAAGKTICLVAHADTTHVPGSSAVFTASANGFHR